jgi:glycosyltransferase involved in cell wall biosynthesis
MSNVSVVVTCYNEAQYIGDAIKSVVQQSCYDDILEIIVVNDGSEDGSEEMVREWEHRCDKLRYVYQENQGLPGARNTGIERCSGDFIALLDGDDIWLEHRLERQLQFVDSFKDVGLVYSDRYVFRDDVDNRHRRYANRYEYNEEHVLQKFFVNDGPIPPSATLINHECFDNVGLFDTDLLRAQDTDMWLRIISKYPIHHISEPLILKRQRSDSLSADVEEKAQYLLQVTDKIANRYPELDRLKHRRKGKIYGGVARNLTVGGERKKAVQAALQAITYDIFAPKHYATLIFTLLPVDYQNLQVLRKLIQAAKSSFRELVRS